MASKVTTLFEDSAKTNALYPRTKVSAVSDGSGNGLDALLNGKQATLVNQTNIKSVNGVTLLGSGNIVPFVGADMSNVIATSSATSGTLSYTATQDCWIYFRQDNGGNNTFTGYINDVEVFKSKDNGGNGIIASGFFPLKKSQVFKATRNGGSAQSYYVAYGLKQ